jgi:hypothetical protein
MSDAPPRESGGGGAGGGSGNRPAAAPQPANSFNDFEDDIPF